MANTGAKPASPKTNTAKSRHGLGSVIFRPNAELKFSAYQSLILIESIILFGLWLLLPKIIPSPMEVLRALQDLVSTQGLLGELWTSLSLNIQAIILSSGISLGLSYLAAIPAFRPITTAVGKGRFLSMVGLSFAFTLMLGGGHALKLGLLTFNMAVFYVTSMADVILQVPNDNLDYVRTLRAGEWRVLWEARILGTLGSAFDIMRQNAAMGWMMLTMVEGMVRGEGGVGRMLVDQEKHFNLASIFAIQLVFLSVGIGQDIFIGWLKSVVAPYSILAYKKHK
jgi:NitT/TauT family transport system permease protein